eukprot:TRINITY_DN338_c0_g1_i2.p1 TRINITY_DN338_c0_g1~~TRINITY_DN338_c0_g1_i2.p1  ORF type:complete len:194 (+),score=43.26 TRINITY_DN338_c0_g1_i2:426-1007(+)
MFVECDAWKEFERELESAITLFVAFMLLCGVIALISILFVIFAGQTMQKYKAWTTKKQRRAALIILSASLFLLLLSSSATMCVWIAVSQYNGRICKDLANDSKFVDETGSHLPFVGTFGSVTWICFLVQSWKSWGKYKTIGKWMDDDYQARFDRENTQDDIELDGSEGRDFCNDGDREMLLTHAMQSDANDAS